MQKGSLEWYSNLWDSARITTDNYSLGCVLHAKRTAVLYKETQYKIVEEKTGVPWYVVAAFHMRECDGDFRCVLHNGEKIVGTPYRTSDIPRGRGPFKTWIDSAVDALILSKFNLVTDWSLENTLKLCEEYNGLGYLRSHENVLSPYLWSCTNHYSLGLYDRDGHFDPDLKDKNCGVVALFKCLWGDVQFTRASKLVL